MAGATERFLPEELRPRLDEVLADVMACGPGDAALLADVSGAETLSELLRHLAVPLVERAEERLEVHVQDGLVHVEELFEKIRAGHAAFLFSCDGEDRDDLVQFGLLPPRE